MKTYQEVFADDLDSLARVVFAVGHPGVAEAYDAEHGKARAADDMPLALHTLIGMFAARVRSEVSDEEKEKARAFGLKLQCLHGNAVGDSNE